MIKRITLVIALLGIVPSAWATFFQEFPKEVALSKTELKDKIKGGWAGQTIGVTYGGPTEFKYLGRIIEDFVEIPWSEDYVAWYFDYYPGLYDDVYMDLSFVEVFEEQGINAPQEAFGNAFAHADFKLWHANQAARYNILNGILPPESGHWKDNLHADCIDFQIEADFAGLMSPGMVNSAAEICDKVGHVMNYGDGWYGGVYVASMYALAFISDDIDFIVREALKTIPSESNYYKCMAQVIAWHEQYPDDWKKAWFEIEQANWKESCPKGVHRAFNIEATVNSAYVLLGLLYGEGDFSKTLEISTRSGQDSDCNPATCAGILGVIKGYDGIPEYWLNPLKKIEDKDFEHTTMSLNDTYGIGYKHAVEMILAQGGRLEGEKVIIKAQEPRAVRLEQSPDFLLRKEVFGDYRFSLIPDNKGVSIRDFKNYEFEGIGLVINGEVRGKRSEFQDYVAEVEFMINGKKIKKMKLPLDFITRSTELFWYRELPKGRHNLELVWLNPMEGIDIILESSVVYDNPPIQGK